MEYFNEMPNKQEKMREVLVAYVQEQTRQDEPTN